MAATLLMTIVIPEWAWAAAAATAALLAFGWVAATTGPLSPIKVTVVRVASGTVSPTLFGIGTVLARRGYLIGPITAGRVERVKAGQLLAEMDPLALDARVGSSAAAAARAQSAVVTAQAQVSDA